jgi:hypothetical protein
MGVVQSIDFESFPKQGTWLNRRVRVCFKYDTTHSLLGTIVREDVEEPGIGIIQLDDKRFVLMSECMYSLIPIVKD